MGKKIEAVLAPVIIVLFTDWRLVFIQLILFLFGTYNAYTNYHDSVWIGAYGALMSMYGVFMITRQLLRTSNEDAFKQETMIDGGSYGLEEDKIKEEKEHEEIRKDIVSKRFGFWLTAVGTLWWGYGEIIFNAFFAGK